MRKKPSGFRVDIQLVFKTRDGVSISSFVEYTSRKIPVTREMAQSLAEHLKRGQAAGRIVQVPEEIVVEEWERRRSTTDSRQITT